MQNHETGKKGEQYAVYYLITTGYEILTTNYNVLGGELDIIAKYNNTLIFFEVKTRKSDKFGLPEESLTYKKRSNLRYAMLKYMNNVYYRGDFRFDLIAIEMNSFDEVKKLRHYKDVQLI